MFSQPIDQIQFSTRRRFLQQCGTGMGAIALGSLLNPQIF
ncbi:MAG: twin-arginine translocation signal domain-containing protein, partial [Verrucomicrobia bacterium]